MKDKTKRIKPPVADISPEKLARLKALDERLRGKFRNFMTQEDLRMMREDDKVEAFETRSK